MKVIICLLLLLQAGCVTTYSATRIDPSTGSETSITIRSFREFPNGIHIKYDRQAGAFEILTGEVKTATSPLEAAAAQIILQQTLKQ